MFFNQGNFSKASSVASIATVFDSFVTTLISSPSSVAVQRFSTMFFSNCSTNLITFSSSTGAVDILGHSFYLLERTDSNTRTGGQVMKKIESRAP